MTTDGETHAVDYEWWAPGSVVNSLWGDAITRLAASVWRAELNLEGPRLPWPPSDVVMPPDQVGDLKAYPLWRRNGRETPNVDPLMMFWDRLAEISFGGRGGFREYQKSALASGFRYSSLLRKAQAVLEYYEPAGIAEAGDYHMQTRIIESRAYDFMLHDGGLDLFVPPLPFKDDDTTSGAAASTVAGGADPRVVAARREIYRQFKFRETGRVPIGLPGLPATGTDPTSQQLVLTALPAASTGASQASEDWLRGMLDKENGGGPSWWVTGAVYRGIMEALPRIIASMWYEELAWPESQDGSDDPRTYASRFRAPGGLKRLLEQRMETKLPDGFEIDVVREEDAPDRERWHARDVMVTNRGLVVPDPMKAPELPELFAAIERGDAGNPVFTSSWPCA